jgi:hypothetical protein
MSCDEHAIKKERQTNSDGRERKRERERDLVSTWRDRDFLGCDSTRRRARCNGFLLASRSDSDKDHLFFFVYGAMVFDDMI